VVVLLCLWESSVLFLVIGNMGVLGGLCLSWWACIGAVLRLDMGDILWGLSCISSWGIGGIYPLRV
jgi:hypothetical protein